MKPSSVNCQSFQVELDKLGVLLQEQQQTSKAQIIDEKWKLKEENQALQQMLISLKKQNQLYLEINHLLKEENYYLKKQLTSLHSKRQYFQENKRQYQSPSFAQEQMCPVSPLNFHRKQTDINSLMQNVKQLTHEVKEINSQRMIFKDHPTYKIVVPPETKNRHCNHKVKNETAFHKKLPKHELSIIKLNNKKRYDNVLF